MLLWISGSDQYDDELAEKKADNLEGCKACAQLYPSRQIA